MDLTQKNINRIKIKLTKKIQYKEEYQVLIFFGLLSSVLSSRKGLYFSVTDFGATTQIDYPHKEGYNTLRIVLTIRLTTRTIRNKYLTILRNTSIFYP